MTAHAEILPAGAADAAETRAALDEIASPYRSGTREQRYDGWSAEKQRRFLEQLSEGVSVTNACRCVGMSVTSAYALRRAPRGASFALAWQAAQLLARERLADELMERAIHGTFETFTFADGTSTTRQRHDNRLALNLLHRLDKLADTAQGAADHAAARLVAGEFDQFLDLVEQEGGPARAGLFLARRLAAEAVDEAAADDLAPVRALARADAWLRRGDAAAASVADLDPAKRGEWSAQDWARAEAAGLLAFAPPPAPAPVPSEESASTPQLPKLHNPDNPDDAPVWWDSLTLGWRTSFPPDEYFYGEEDGEYGEEGYSRELSPEELEVIEAPIRAEREAQRLEAERARDAWFAPDAEEAAEAEAEVAEGKVEAEAESDAGAATKASLPAVIPAAPSQGKDEDARPETPPSSSRRRGSTGAGMTVLSPRAEGNGFPPARE